MNEKTKAILDAREKQIDVELEEERIKIDEEYTKRGIPGSGPHLRARGLAGIKAQAKKDEIRAMLEVKQEKRSRDGVIHYYLGIPPYDEKTAAINFGGHLISIPPNTNLEYLCRVIFSSEAKIKYVWSWEEILEHKNWGEHVYNNNGWRKVYNAVDGVNEKVSAKTTIEDLLLHLTVIQVQINPKYLK